LFGQSIYEEIKMAEQKTSGSFSKAEQEAMKERAREAKLEERRLKGENLKAADLADVLDKISKMAPADRVLAEGIHALVTEVAPELDAKTWYGMPAYGKDGKTICFFQDAGKFKARYSTLGFSDLANLDDGEMWASSYALVKLTPAVKKQIAELIKKAVR
jgi:uncharacterized protein YdhG (YjbR/CyaY superfamily)